MDDKHYQITVFCDFSKAFDTIHDPILLKKLEVYEFRGKTNDWFKSYLSNRQQYTVFNKALSSHNKVNFGVP